MKQVRVIPLGISAGVPTRERNVSATLLLFDGRALLFDCGEGTQHQIMRAPMRLGELELVCISHLHGDHLYGLPGLLASLNMRHRSTPLWIAGPPGIEAYITAVLRTSVLTLGYSLNVVESMSGQVHAADGYHVLAAPLEHSTPSVGFCWIEDDRPGHLDIEKALRLGVPSGPLLAELKSGRDVTLEGGQVISSGSVVGPPIPGRRVAYCCDSRPCPGSVELSRDASLLIHEATYGEELAAEASERAHSTARQAAGVAAAAGVDRLLLTHFSPRYETFDELRREAAEVFPGVELAEELVPISL